MIPDSHVDLLTRPLFAHLGTLNSDGTPQVTPVWQVWDGEFLRLTTTTDRAKCRNVERDPAGELSVNDPERPYRYLEVRGLVGRGEPAPEGEVFYALARRYALDSAA